jgi:hypothetical protein
MCTPPQDTSVVEKPGMFIAAQNAGVQGHIPGFEFLA